VQINVVLQFDQRPDQAVDQRTLKAMGYCDVLGMQGPLLPLILRMSPQSPPAQGEHTRHVVVAATADPGGIHRFFN